MPDFEKRSRMKAAIASIGRGELQQMRIVGDELEELDERLEKMEGSGGQAPEPQPQPSSGPDVSSVQSVEPVSETANASDVRKSVREMQSRFNQLLEAFKNG